MSEPSGSTRQALIILNEESIAPIEAARGGINFGFGSITLRIYKGDKPGANSNGPSDHFIAVEQGVEKTTAPAEGLKDAEQMSTDIADLTGGLFDLAGETEQEDGDGLLSDEEDHDRTVINIAEKNIEGSAD